MLAYTPAELQAFDHDRAPPRSVWKELFPWRLWRPARYRRRIVRRVEMSAPDVNKPTRRSADRRSMLVGWLNVQSLSPNKIDPVNELVADCSLDVLALSETWHSSSDDARLRLAMPAGYTVADAPRGGGIAVIYRKHLKCSWITLPPCDTFEALCSADVISWPDRSAQHLPPRLGSTVGEILQRVGVRTGGARRPHLSSHCRQ